MHNIVAYTLSRILCLVFVPIPKYVVDSPGDCADVSLCW